MKKLKQTYLRSGRTLGAVLLLLMIVGSIWDLPISKFLYPGRESSFGQFFAAFGELPAFLAMTSAGILLFFNRKRLRRGWNVLFIAASAVLVLGGAVLSVHEATDNVPAMPLWVALLVTVFAAALTGFLLLLGTEGCQTKTIVRFILALAFISIGTMLLINVIKIPWGRPRMRLLLSTGNESYFQPWWKLGGGLKARLIAEGVSSDEFRSFPSGHTGCAACAMLAILLPTVCKRLRGKERICLIIGAVWTAVVAFSRLMMGAHFLTDVTAATAITLGVTWLGVWLFYFNGKLFRVLWGLISEPSLDARNTKNSET